MELGHTYAEPFQGHRSEDHTTQVTPAEDEDAAEELEATLEEDATLDEEATELDDTALEELATDEEDAPPVTTVMLHEVTST